MKRWILNSPETLTRMHGLPTEVAQSENYHFYSPNEVEIDNFRLLAFVKPAHRNDYVTFRFWSLNDESEPLGKYNILLPQDSGRIRFKNYEIEELIQLLKEHGHTLEDANPNGRLFQFIMEEEYQDYYIETHFPFSFDNAYYLCVSDLEEIEPNYDKLFNIIWGRDGVRIATFLLPQNIKSYDEFEVFSLQHRGGLNLTKQGVEELCQLLSRHF